MVEDTGKLIGISLLLTQSNGRIERFVEELSKRWPGLIGQYEAIYKWIAVCSCRYLHLTFSRLLAKTIKQPAESKKYCDFCIPRDLKTFCANIILSHVP